MKLCIPFLFHKNLPVSVSLVPSPNTNTEVKVEIHSEVGNFDFESKKMATSTPKQK